jgi:hypothetical protein
LGGCRNYPRAPKIIGPMKRERAMSTRAQSRVALKRKRDDVVALEDDRWVWGVIFTTTALTGLCVATLFSVALV